MAEGCLGHLSAYNTKEMKGLSYILKDERSLCKIQGDVCGMQGKFELKLNFFSSVSILRL